MMWPFNPTQPSQTITVGATTGNTALNGVANETRQCELQNASSDWVFVAFGPDNTVTTTVAAGYPVGPGQSKIVTVNANMAYIAAIGAVGSQTLYVTMGHGLS